MIFQVISSGKTFFTKVTIIIFFTIVLTLHMSFTSIFVGKFFITMGAFVLVLIGLFFFWMWRYVIWIFSEKNWKFGFLKFGKISSNQLTRVLELNAILPFVCDKIPKVFSDNDHQNCFLVPKYFQNYHNQAIWLHTIQFSEK